MANFADMILWFFFSPNLSSGSFSTSLFLLSTGKYFAELEREKKEKET